MALSEEYIYCRYYNVTFGVLEPPNDSGHGASLGTEINHIVLLPASVVLNVCLILASCLRNFLERKWKSASLRKFFSLPQNRLVVSKIFTEHVFTLLLFVFGMYLLCTTPLLKQPFIFCEDKTLILVAISMNLGKYVYLTYTAVLSTDSNEYLTLCIHHFVTLVCYLFTVVYGQNLLAAVLGLLMDSSTICFSMKTILKNAGVQKHEMKMVAVRSGGSILNIMFRGALPAVFMSIALTNQNPSFMKPIPLAVLALQIMFYSVVNAYLIFSSLRTLFMILTNTNTQKTDTYVQNNIKSDKPPLIPVVAGSNLDKKNMHLKSIANANVETGSMNNYLMCTVLNIDGKNNEKLDVRTSISHICDVRDTAQSALRCSASRSNPRPVDNVAPHKQNNNNNQAKNNNSRITPATLYTISEVSEETTSVFSDSPSVISSRSESLNSS